MHRATEETHRQVPIAIVGATATGKSSLALNLARALGACEIISVDSMQVYRHMDIGTAKPTRAERDEIPHHCIDVVDPNEEFSLAEFQHVAAEAASSIERRGNRIIYVGGTGLYVRAIIDGLSIPGQYDSVRDELEAINDTRSLYAELQSADPIAASRMEPDNRRRIVRALEVIRGSGRPFSSFGPGLEEYPELPVIMIGLECEPEVLARRIDRRIDAMFDAGFVEEVSALQHRYRFSRTAAQAIGYAEITEALAQPNYDPSVLRDRIASRTRKFARRQRSWFRRDPRIRWLAIDTHIDDVIERIHDDTGEREST